MVCRVGPLSFLNVTPVTFISRYSNCFDKSGTFETVAGWIVAVLLSFVKMGGVVGAVSVICGTGTLGAGVVAGVPAVSVFDTLSCKD